MLKKFYIISGLLFFSLQLSLGQTFTRKVLFEEATNASCIPCAQYNPILTAFLNANPNTIIAIKYHASWPGFDPMYQANPVQNTERIVVYYSINALPWLNVDGIINDVWPFTQANFQNALDTRLAIPSPILITVTDQRIAGDSIRASILVYKPTGLPSGNYRLRVMAIEGKIIYPTPPGTNGESVFEHVFRWAYPNVGGVTVTTGAGTQNFTYTYKRESAWVDTSMYTVAFVQNDNNKEVLNVAKGTYTTGINNINSEIPSGYSLSQNYPNPFNPATNISFSLPEASFVTLKIYDMIGREIAVLVNGELKAGYYNADWNAANFTSGVYFYTLRAGRFVDTKKMILIK